MYSNCLTGHTSSLTRMPSRVDTHAHTHTHTHTHTHAHNTPTHTSTLWTKAIQETRHAGLWPVYAWFKKFTNPMKTKSGFFLIIITHRYSQ